MAIACAASPKTSTSDKDLTDKPNDGDKSKDNSPPASNSPPPAAASGAAPAAPGAPIAAAKIQSTVKDFAVTADALWFATDTAVQKAGLDGTNPAPQAFLAGSVALATDGTRVYGMVDHGDEDDLVSLKGDGTDPKTHAQWNKADGDATTLSVHDGRVYLTTTQFLDPTQSEIASVPAIALLGDFTQWRLDELAESGVIPPAFGTGTLFAVDYSRAAALRVAIGDSSSAVDIIDADLPRGAGGISTDGTDVYTRTGAGVVKVPVGAAVATQPTVVVPSSACSIFDPGDGSTSNVEDALAVDATSIYVACRAAGNVEVRAYTKDGKTSKVVGAVPYNGGLNHLRVSDKAVYWLTAPAGSLTFDLWRGGK
jgi:hypothetical protein